MEKHDTLASQIITGMEEGIQQKQFGLIKMVHLYSNESLIFRITHAAPETTEDMLYDTGTMVYKLLMNIFTGLKIEGLASFTFLNIDPVYKTVRLRINMGV